MKIKIDPANCDKIEAVLAETNGKAQERTLDAEDVFGLARDCERRLDDLGIPKKLRSGALGRAHGFHGKMPPAYRYRLGVTAIDIIRGTDDWFFINAWRAEYWPTKRFNDTLGMTEA